MPIREIRHRMGLPRNTVRKYLADQCLEQIANICNLVAEFFEGDPATAALGFRTANPRLGNIYPRDMVRRGRLKRL